MLDLLNAVAVRSPDAVIGWRGGEPLRAAAFLARARAWRALALRIPGADVSLYLDDSLEFAAALLGSWQARKTVWLAANTLEPGCEALAASVDAFLGEFPARFAPQTPAAGDCCELAFTGLDPGFDALVVHTSGSTGQAQAIPKKLGQLAGEVATLEVLFGARIGAAAVVATVSHQHIYGLLFRVLWPLAAGRDIHAHSLAYPEQLAEKLGQRPCVLVASPAHLKRLPSHLDWSGAGANLRAVFSSGGPLPAAVSVEARRLLGLTPVEVYGSSESGGIAWRENDGGNAAWQPMPGVAVRAGADGLLEVRSAHLPDDQWMAMADRAEVRPGGCFLLLGRSDRIVKIEEVRISLDAIEAALLATGMAQEARVLVGDAVPGQRSVVAAFAVLSPAGRALLGESGKAAFDRHMRALLAGSVEPVALPRRWRYLDQMPADAQGKTTHAQLTALLGAGLDPRPRRPQVRLLEQDAQRVLYEVVVPPGLFYLDGHFAQAPVLPGVVQVDWAILYGRLHFPLGPAFRAMHALKFQNVIGAGVPVSLELVHDAGKDSLTFRYFSAAGQHAGGRIAFGPIEESPC
ncbi:AMP-binding protein [Massilia sp. RP-1-19]|uniref:AMP-binding protein n=1 Tax=Massilia polaris TaxID=2728846 RepID=A0A848HFZ0_9BURK|nr:AMP-binding protein [Massilia polaris]NML59987.1 AMP-binding protein [Massilia polaris]